MAGSLPDLQESTGVSEGTIHFYEVKVKSLTQYLGERNDNSPALWSTNPTRGSDRLTYWGLRSMIIRRSKSAGFGP